MCVINDVHLVGMQPTAKENDKVLSLSKWSCFHV